MFISRVKKVERLPRLKLVIFSAHVHCSAFFINVGRIRDSRGFLLKKIETTTKNSLEKKKFGLDDETFVYCPTVPSRGVTKYPPILEKIFELFLKNRK